MNIRIDFEKYLLMVLFGILLLQTACETVITIDPPKHTPQIAFHAFTNQKDQNQLLILASQTVGIFDSTLLLGDAILEFEGPDGIRYPEPNELMEIRDTFFYEDTFFVNRYFLDAYNFDLADLEVEEGATYTLRGSYPGFPDASASQKIPFTVLPDSVIYIENAGLDQFGDPVSAVDIYWQDPPDENNFYMARLLYDTILTITTRGLWIESIDPSASRYEEGITISDNTFNGESKRLRVTFYRNDFSASEPKFLEWSCITEDTYEYGRSLIRYWDSVDNPFVTPAQLYTNVDGGVGIFSLHKRNYVEIIE